MGYKRGGAAISSRQLGKASLGRCDVRTLDRGEQETMTSARRGFLARGTQPQGLRRDRHYAFSKTGKGSVWLEQRSEGAGDKIREMTIGSTMQALKTTLRAVALL